MAAEYKLNNRQLEAAVKTRRFSEQAVEVARRILVDGAAVPEILAEYDINRSRVYQIRDQVWAAHLQNSLYPSTWKTVTLTASPQLIEEFTRRAEEERQEWLKEAARSAPKPATPKKKAAK